MTPEQVYVDLNYNWWTDECPTGTTGNAHPTAQLYYQQEGGQYGMYSSTGEVTASTNRQNYVKNYLMQDAARYLSETQCTGNITNIRPSEYYPLPIYFK